MLLNKFSYKKLLSFLLCIVMFCSFVTLGGCTDEHFSLYFGVDSMPKNIDPQKASLYSEHLAVRNCFRGLYKFDTLGSAVPDLAESTSVSDDGLTYTFQIKNSKWKDGTPVTADDFVFAVMRASDPVTASPSANLLTVISGVDSRLSGDESAVIGVKAIDSSTVSYTLTKPNKNFTSLLAQSVFMPCNQAFFENCKGKYGLDRQNILTNGAYYPSQWLENRHLKLTLVNEPDTDALYAQNVYLTFSTSGKNNIARINAKEIGMTADNTNDFSSVDTSVFTVKSLYQKNYALVFNKSTDVGKNTTLTEAFAQAIHHELYVLKMSERFKKSDTVLPADSMLFSQSVGDFSGYKHKFEYNPESARNDFLESLKQFKNKKLPEIKVLTVDRSEIKTVLNEVVSQWQSTLGAYVNITTVSTDEKLLQTVTDNNFTVALIPLSGNTVDILSCFADANSGAYLHNEQYDSLVKSLLSTDDTNTAKQIIGQCLEILSGDSAVIPIITVPTAYIYDSKYNNVVFSKVDGTVDFSIIYKNK